MALLFISFDIYCASLFLCHFNPLWFVNLWLFQLNLPFLNTFARMLSLHFSQLYFFSFTVWSFLLADCGYFDLAHKKLVGLWKMKNASQQLVTNSHFSKKFHLLSLKNCVWWRNWTCEVQISGNSDDSKRFALLRILNGLQFGGILNGLLQFGGFVKLF